MEELYKIPNVYKDIRLELTYCLFGEISSVDKDYTILESVM